MGPQGPPATKAPRGLLLEAIPTIPGNPVPSSCAFLKNRSFMASIPENLRGGGFKLWTVSPHLDELPDGVSGFSSHQGCLLMCLLLEDIPASQLGPNLPTLRTFQNARHSHRRFFHQSGVVAEREAVSTQVPTLRTSPLHQTFSLPAVLVKARRHHVKWTVLTIQAAVTWRPSSYTHRPVHSGSCLGERASRTTEECSQETEVRSPRETLLSSPLPSQRRELGVGLGAWEGGMAAAFGRLEGEAAGDLEFPGGAAISLWEIDSR
ncbi:uncharacterized protein LOC122229371 [Panthera leo]|uniref:uncharacterized protein LOC122229371 n=1 Tax=Panthera leo TaxID=9689 RepID=UPI001C6A74CD|nr:uncharacterized protein LOC122229371 [Panthera leo]